jgi:hypothetical protein
MTLNHLPKTLDHDRSKKTVQRAEEDNTPSGSEQNKEHKMKKHCNKPKARSENQACFENGVRQ